VTDCLQSPDEVVSNRVNLKKYVSFNIDLSVSGSVTLCGME